MSSLLARYAECIYWLARYVERAENLARLLDVNETFSRDASGGQDWHQILQINSDTARYLDRNGEATGEGVVYFYLIDRENPTSILSSIRAARENARTLRALVSTEMWSQLNVFYNELLDLSPSDIALPKLSRLCAQIKERCQTHTGITDGTFFRDQGWFFYQIGKAIERADQTTRLVDIKYDRLTPHTEHSDTPVDARQWNALLRSAAAYHAFRRIHPRGMNPVDIVGFILLNPAFPRSAMNCVRAAEVLLADLKSRYRLRGGVGAQETLDELRVALESHPIDEVIARGLHNYLDWTQRQLITVSNELGYDFFGAERPQARSVSILEAIEDASPSAANS